MTEQGPETAFQSDLGALLRTDGVTWLEHVEPESVDLVVADPPYNLGKSEWDRFASGADYLEWSRRWVAAAQRALKPEGTLYLMGFSEILAEIKAAVAPELVAKDPRSQPAWSGARWLVWFYRNKANLRDDWGRSHESVLHLRKAKRFTFHTDAVRIPYNAHTVRYPARTQAESSQYGGARKDRWQPHPLGARPRDVLEIPVLANGTKEKTKHPTQKPLQLIKKLVLASSSPGDLVVDPFSGSGTTAVVCEANQRRWRACELDPSYLALSAERLADPQAHQGAQSRDSEAQTTRRRGKLRSG